MYAKAGVTKGHQHLVVIDQDTNKMIGSCFEADDEKGTYKIHTIDEQGNLGLEEKRGNIKIMNERDYHKSIAIKEGMVKKGGLNKAPSIPRPSEPPKGQGGRK